MQRKCQEWRNWTVKISSNLPVLNLFFALLLKVCSVTPNGGHPNLPPWLMASTLIFTWWLFYVFMLCLDVKSYNQTFGWLSAEFNYWFSEIMTLIHFPTLSPMSKIISASLLMLEVHSLSFHYFISHTWVSNSSKLWSTSIFHNFSVQSPGHISFFGMIWSCPGKLPPFFSQSFLPLNYHHYEQSLD